MQQGDEETAQVGGLPVGGPWRHVCLAHDHRASASDPRDDGCIRFRSPIGEGHHASGASYALYRSLVSSISAAIRAPELVSRAPQVSASEFIRWLDEREEYRTSCREFFAEWDILLAPVACALPFAHSETPLDDRTIAVNGQVIPCRLMLVYPSLATLSGQPATAFPVGLSRSGLPIGLQAIGPYLEDHTPIHFSAQVAAERGGFRQPPAHAIV